MTTAPVVVAVDGSSAAVAAVDYAVDEARLRHRPLRVVYAERWTEHPAWLDAARGNQIVQQALDRVTARSAVPVTGAVIPGHPASVLADESRHAQLLILGLRAHGHLPGAVTSGAACPVLVVRETGNRSGHVLVGVNGSAHSDAAVGFAFDEAAMRGTPLVALHAWTGPLSTGPGDMLPLVYEPAAVAEEAAQDLSGSLAGWRAKYPEVAVEQRLVPGRAGPALVAGTAHAGLVVVGTRGHRTVPGWLVGSVPHLLLHQARCPVAVVPEA